jgi:hypothetical protein
MIYLNELKKCFNEDFEEWLLNNSCPEIGPYKGDWWRESSRMRQNFYQIEKKYLKEILDILLNEPEADYFYFSSNLIYNKLLRNRINYSLYKQKYNPGNSITINKEKIKLLLRDIKLDSIMD